MPTDKQFKQFAYVLATLCESKAMAIRLNEAWQNQPGYAAHFIHRVSRQVVKSMLVAWADYIPEATQSRPTIPILRDTVWLWDNFGQRLSSIPFQSENYQYDWQILLAGLKAAAVTSWLRELALELQADTHWPMLSSDVDLADEWGIEEPVLSQKIVSLSDFTAFFADGFSSVKPDDLNAVTPLGWLALVAGRMGLIGKDSTAPLDYEWLAFEAKSDSATAIKQLCEDIKKLAGRLAPTPLDEEARKDARREGDRQKEEEACKDWPFENMPVSLLGIWDEAFAEESYTLLGKLDRLCGFHVNRVHKASWRFEPREHKFTDAEGIVWKLQPWQIALSDGRKPFATEHNRRYLSQWSETRNKDRILFGVAAIGEHLGKFIPNLPAISRESPEKITVVSIKEKVPQETSLVSNAESINAPKADTSNDIFTDNVVESPAPRSNVVEYIKGLREKWLEYQETAWNLRHHRAGSHIRLALLQWKVDESYRHPRFELVMETKMAEAWYGEEQTTERKKKVQNLDSNNKEPIMSPSWAEHRRRRLLEEALRACDRFGVNVLVLPEYSVRPDTVGWLKKKIERTSSKVTILAGTYRLHGHRSPSDKLFSDCYSEILGVADFGSVRPVTVSEDNVSLIASGEKSAILSLLVPIELKGSSLVSVFTRRKKYSSLAASEVFNPGTSEWKPLLTLDALINDLQYRCLKTGQRLASSTENLSANDVLTLLDQVKEERYLAELICSELFLVTNPANWFGIASEYHKLLKRFGSSKTIKTLDGVKELIQGDLWALAQHLGISGIPPLENKKQNSSSGADIPRRSVILLPAMTSRSADYWIFGQSALLASGITTVFCNAVSGKDSVGGSCVIGRESWKDGKVTPGLPSIVTPYCGWSRGIYYNKKKEALGEEEQAMVVVDIDPVHMMEGKPRPQALPVPLQLVAHLPIAETIDWNNKPYKPPPDHKHDANKQPFSDARKLTDIIGRFEAYKQQIKSPTWNPEMQNGSESLSDWAEKLAPFFGCACENDGGKTAFKERLNQWKAEWRDLPFSGYPPAIMDWLWVDLTPPEDDENGVPNFPKIFVPPYIAD